VLYARGLPPFVTGFVPGRSLLANAVAHVGQKYVVKIDIKDFFPSVPSKKVQDEFRSFGYPEKVTSLLTNLCTWRAGLPQGAPTSPYLANLVFLPCDRKLKEWADRAGVTYTRYADDLTFSSTEPMDAVTVDLVDLIGTFGFRVNPKKTRSWHPGQRLITTGMVVNEKAHPPRRFRRRLRAIFHQASLDHHRFKSESRRLLGWAAFVNMYDGKRGQDYLRIARSVTEKL
jgi:RNA-directed DNA polymerase